MKPLEHIIRQYTPLDKDQKKPSQINKPVSWDHSSLLLKSRNRNHSNVSFKSSEKTYNNYEATKVQATQARLLPKRHSPKFYQNTAIDKVIKGFEEHNRGQLILPCGTGKTETALWIKEKLKPKKTLCLFPSIALVKQTKERWEEQRDPNKNYDYLCVCSDPGVDSKKRSKGDEENEAEEFKALGGSKVTSNSDDINKFLKQEGDSVVFATYQSLPKIIEAMKNNNIEFDLTIADEAHVTAGEEGRLFTAMHDNNNLRSKKRLYMTATPRVLSENSQANGDSTLIGMNNQDVYGPEFHRMSFAEAIQARALVDYKLVVLGIKPGESVSIINRQNLNISEADLSSVAKSVALDKFMEDNGLRRALTFHSRTDNAENFAKTRKLVTGNEDSYYVDGTMPVTVRNRILDQFKAAKGSSTVSNARCLTAGVDVPSIDTVVFIDPKSKNAKVDIVQAAGRAMRKDPKNPNKKCGYIVLPVILTEDGAINKRMPSYEGLKHVISSLALHDERLETSINQTRNQDEQSNSPFVTPAIEGPEIQVLTLDDTLEKINTIKNEFEFTEEVIACSREMLTGSRYRNFKEASHALLSLAPNKPKKLKDIEDLPITLNQLNRLAIKANLIDESIGELEMINLIWEGSLTISNTQSPTSLLDPDQVIIKYENWVNDQKTKNQPYPSNALKDFYYPIFQKSFSPEEIKIIKKHLKENGSSDKFANKLVQQIWGNRITDKELIEQIRKEHPFFPKNYPEILQTNNLVKNLSFFKKHQQDPKKLALMIWDLSPLDFDLIEKPSRYSTKETLKNMLKGFSNKTIELFYELRSKYPTKLSLNDLEKLELYKQVEADAKTVFGNTVILGMQDLTLAEKISFFVWGAIPPILNLEKIQDLCREEPKLNMDTIAKILVDNGNSRFVSPSQLDQILHQPDKYTNLEEVFNIAVKDKTYISRSVEFPNINLLGLRISKDALTQLIKDYAGDDWKSNKDPYFLLQTLALHSSNIKELIERVQSENYNINTLKSDEEIRFNPNPPLEYTSNCDSSGFFNYQTKTSKDSAYLTLRELRLLAKLKGINSSI